MEIYTQLHSTLILNDKKLLVDVFKWAGYTLSTDRLAEFCRDNSDIVNQYFNIPGFKHELIYSSNAVDNLGNKIVIGLRYIFPETKIVLEKYEYWQNEFANDSRVTYRPWIKES